MSNPATGADQQTETRSTLISRNITILGHRTSVRLEPEMWTALRDITRREGCRTHDLCSLIQLRKKPDTSLTAAIRVFLMLYYRASSTEEGHQRCGHGNFANMLNRARVTMEDIVKANPHPQKQGPGEFMTAIVSEKLNGKDTARIQRVMS
ncbi:MAG: ribbon-helix-helix domain-containing protein [Micavibrio sp.]